MEKRRGKSRVSVLEIPVFIWSRKKLNSEVRIKWETPRGRETEKLVSYANRK